MRVAAVLAAALGGAEAWNWEPRWMPSAPYIEPTARCVHDFGNWVRDKSQYYVAACLTDELLEELSERLAAPQPADETPHAQPASGTLRSALKQIASGVSLAKCATSCFHSSQWALGTEWIYGLWNSSDWSCLCAGAVTIPGGMEQLYAPMAERPDPEPNGQATIQYCTSLSLLRIPTSCLWQSQDACIAAPGPPDGCIWTLEHCCVDAKGFTWPYAFWPVPWWVLAIATGLAVVALFGVLLSAISLCARRVALMRPNMHSPNHECPEERRRRIQADKLAFTELLVQLQTEQSQAKDEGVMCCICLESLESGQLIELRCGHRLHHQCMLDYTIHLLERGSANDKPKCPTCRGGVVCGAPGVECGDQPEFGAQRGAEGEGSDRGSPRRPRDAGSVDEQCIELAERRRTDTDAVLVASDESE
eukprot:TRINITY_DN4648_c3_g1_i1.p1 TRINITY_DN4648_c3_g1~~TRINITY_DN4648_c3_g1_i1.p1  ORF type:complete len:420 (+),score=90.58 TRINITY_DN4648_c3_g1_i1:298-1557(+)